MALDWPLPRRGDDGAMIPLSGVRAEFRTALRAEIEAAERAVAMSAVALRAGRRVGRLADGVEYVFSSALAIAVPGDTPGELVVEGLPPLPAVVVSVEGLDVTVSVPRELGDRVPGAILRRDPVLPLRRLIARIEEAGATPNPAGDRLLGDAPASGAPVVIEDALLDGPQNAALASGLGRDVTFMCGPPGVGKTRTIGAIGAHLYRLGRSLLLVADTNRAVDQALMEIAEQLGQELGAGVILRLGAPCDRRLREREDLLFDAVVWNRQEQLRERQARLWAERAPTQKRVAESERLLDVAAWAGEGRAELAGFLVRLRTLHIREASACRLAGQVAHRAEGEGELVARLAEGRAAARAATLAGRLRAELPWLTDELDAAREAVGVADAAVAQARSELMRAVELEPLVARERALGPLVEQRRAAEALAVREAEARLAVDAAREALREADATRSAAAGAKGIPRRFGGLGSRVRARQLVARRRAQLAAVEARLDGVSRTLGRARGVLAELEELERRLAPWRALGSAARQAARLRRLEAERGLAAATRTRLEQRRERIERQLAEAVEAVKHFRRLHAAEPRGLVARLEEQLAELRRLREKLRETEQLADELREALDADLSARLVSIETLGLGHSSSLGNAEERFTAAAFAHSEARRLATKIDAVTVQSEIAAGRRELRAIDDALGGIDQQLEATRQAVIADAKVIAAPLTHVYLRDELQDRRFDTVILDEASLAPIPALWIAARLADANVVVVGDRTQPPPVKQSEHPLADKWLGQHILDPSHLEGTAHHGNPPRHFIQLNAGEQNDPHMSQA
jgi:hypothetical protein